MLYIIYICVYIHIHYLFIYLGFSFTIVLYVCYLLWNYFMCILLYMIMCMLLSATSTHFKWELMLYCLHCPTLNKVFLLLLLLFLLKCNWNHLKTVYYSWSTMKIYLHNWRHSRIIWFPGKCPYLRFVSNILSIQGLDQVNSTCLGRFHRIYIQVCLP